MHGEERVLHDKAEGVDTTRALTGIVAAYVLGNCWTYFMPMLVGCMVDAFGVRAGTAGIVMGVELGAMAFSCLALPFVIGAINVRLIVYFAAAVLLVGNVLSIWSALSKTWLVFIVARSLTGFAEGCLAAGADARSADRATARSAQRGGR